MYGREDCPAGGASLTSILEELQRVLLSKRHDYGDPARTLGRFGVKGLVPRIVDKTERLVTLTWEGKEPKNESVRDTLLDLAGYAVLGLWLLDT